MKKIVLATIAIWFVAISSAAALVNVLVRKPVATPVDAQEALLPTAEPPIDLDKFKVPVPSIVSAPAKMVRSHLRMPARHTRPAKREMRCTAFRPMQFGTVGQGVRYCK